MKKTLFITAALTLFSVAVNAFEIQRLQPEGVPNTSQWGFSQSVVTPNGGHYIFISGQYSGDETGKLVGDTLEEQTKQVYKNLKTIIEASGGSPENVVQIRTLLKDFDPSNIDVLLIESKKLFGEHLPASTLIAVPELAIPGMLIEVEATVYVPEKGE